MTRGHLQVVALGWCFGEQAYLRSSWNVLDGLLVLISIIDILVSMVSDSGTKILGMLRVLRLLRTLRPLRCPCQAHPDGQHPICPCFLPVTPPGTLPATSGHHFSLGLAMAPVVSLHRQPPQGPPHVTLLQGTPYKGL